MIIWIITTILFILIMIISIRLKYQYRKNISENLNRLSVKSHIVETPLGVIEYSLKGDCGPFVLISHGGAGGFDQGLITAQTHLKGNYRIISVSRFGHLRSSMIEGANAELQADVYALLLDHLEIERAAILGSSGGGPSAIQFAQRHSDKCSSLILSCAVSQFHPARPTSVYKSDFFYWLITTKLKKLALKMIGVTKGIEKKLTDGERVYLGHIFDTMNPISIRREGLFCDIEEWANRKTWDTRYKLNELLLPVLIIHAENDSVIPFTQALQAHRAISGSILMALTDGGHLKLGHLSEIQKTVNSFLKGDKMKQTLRDDNILTLKSGKNLGYAEYGNPEGIPILVHHGNPGSRLFWGLLPESPFNENYRLIAPDRPGYGLSDHYGKESILKWPGIIEELMDHLKIDRFYNAGVSGGGPYALTCAASLPERILETSLISPVGPFVKESVGDMNVNRKLFALAGKLPWLIKFQFHLTTKMVRKNPDSFIALFKKKVKGPDRELIETVDIQNLLKIDFIEAYRQGEAGSLYDCFIPADWPIELKNITGKIHIWYGDLDRSIGDMAKYTGEKIPGAVTHCIPGVGHFLVFKKAKEIFASMIHSGN